MNQSQNGKRTEDGITSDAELVHAARSGDKRAFVEIVARHQAMVCGITLGILGDFAASEDAGQEAFLTAWRKLQELREPERLRAWLAQIARNAALGQLRRTRKHEPLEDALTLADQSLLPDESSANEDEAELVRAFLNRLPEMYRLPLVLFYREGQSVRAVAETLDLTEDAVKQRLARGREMLRDRMAGLFETVLTRSAPTTIFTMTIAAAIGALAAPAAVAGSVFTATSIATSTASSSAASSTSLLTVMSTSKTFLAVTALVAVAFIPAGYHIPTNQQPPTENQLTAKTDSNVPTLPQPSAPNFESSTLFVEWRELHEKYGTNAAAMPALYKAITDIKDPFRRRAFQSALVAEWVQLDAPGGLKFYLGKGPDKNQRRQFIEEWLALDAPAAINGLLASGPGWESVALDCLSEFARRAPSRLGDIVARLPKGEYWDTNVRDAFAIVARSDLSSARKAAEALSGPNREQALSGVAQAWAKSDFNKAVAWARSLPEGTNRDQIIRAALVGLAAVNPAAALESVDFVPPGGRHAHFGDTTGARVLIEAAQTDFDGTVAWLTDHPGQFTRDELMGLSQAVTERLNSDPIGFLNAHAASGSLAALMPAIQSALLNGSGGQRAAVWEWLKTQPENETTKSLKSEVITSAAWQNPELALQLVSDLPLTKEGDAQVKELARCLLDGGNKLHRFEKLYDEVPDRLRQPLVEAAFNSLGGKLNDPQQWISRLSLLPEASRSKGIESLARAWARETPEEAIGWVTSLPASDARNASVVAVTSAWAIKDAHGAAEWVSVMQPGIERDRGAEGVALAIAERFPREAWDWALNIDDEAGRNRTATEVVKKMATLDSTTVRQWIETGPFTAEAKANLQSVLEKRGNLPTQ